MKLAASIKKCPVVTVINGWVQATHEGAAFVEFLPKAEKLSFCVNAKTFIEAIQSLESSYHIKVEDEYVLLFDSVKEIKLLKKPSELLVTIPNDWNEGDLAKVWTQINEFATADFPAIRITEKYMEALSHNTIIRLEHEFEVLSCNVMTYKILKHSIGYTFHEQFLWFRYSNTQFVALSLLDVHLPNTNSFFNAWEIGRPIPSKLKTKLLPSDFVTFKQNNLILHIDKIADTFIEAVTGHGKYEYRFFRKAIDYGLTWTFLKKTLLVTGYKIKLVLGNLES